jgi:hypothetical protein
MKLTEAFEKNHTKWKWASATKSAEDRYDKIVAERSASKTLHQTDPSW